MSFVRSAVVQSVRNILSRQQLLNTRLHTGRRFLRSLPASLVSPRVWSRDGQILGAATSRFLFTTGDKELVEFLKDEIQLEKKNRKNQGKSTKIKGFELVETDGPNVTLKKVLENESVTIRFNVNNSVDDSTPDLEVDNQQDQQSAETKMVSKPAFLVEINKGGSKTLAIQCVFPPPDDYPPAEHDQEESYEDVIEIQDVALLEKSQEWTDDVYSLSASVMDGNLYDMLMKMLEERGVDADFVDQLTEFSTSYEQSKYVDTLEKLKEFVDSK